MKKFKNNAEWLQFISDLQDLSCFLRSENVDMDGNAEIVDKAIELLIEWNPKRKESIERGDTK
jgi:ubiquinone biosynthesis protein UbiJ